MKKGYVRRVCWLTLGLVWISTPLSAAVVSSGNYVQAFIDLDAGAGPASGRNQTVLDASFADTLAQAPLVNAGWQASGRAQASIDHGLSLRAITSSTAPAAAGFSPPSSGTLVRAAWHDALLPAAAGAPSSLEFVFDVHAELSITPTTRSPISGAPNFTQAVLNVRGDANIVGFASPVFGTARSAMLSSNNGTSGGTSIDERGGRWDSAVFTELAPNLYSFNGRFTHTAILASLPFLGDAAPFGAYLVSIGLSLQTATVGGTANVDAFSTLTLAAIQLPGGGDLPAGMHFDSGLSVTAVPLPPSLSLLSLAVLGCAWRCRTRGAVRAVGAL